METLLAQALMSLGPGGVMCWILLQQQKLQREDRQAEAAARLDHDKERLTTDKRLAAAMVVLAMKITGRPIDGDAA